MIQLYKNPSGDNVYLSKYHQQDMGCTNKLAVKEHSLNSVSSSFDPTASLRSLFRRVSGAVFTTLSIMINCLLKL